MPDPLHVTLKETFGFDSFRPLQEAIIRDALAGRDVFALLPTGGGKSLCFQIPALHFEGLTVVVSPLIALMKDQVDGLRANGVAATFLNSSLDTESAKSRLRDLHDGRIRLLYVAPERLMLSGFLADLQKWNVALFAIDEAHCISEWGHDFRPEYRQIATLRKSFPKVPVMALTATATDRVRDDIVGHLALRDPARYVASFNRPNLSYQVIPKGGGAEQICQWIKGRAEESGIVYCQSRKSTESLAEALRRVKVPAAAYHAGLEPELRATTQEKFLRDEIGVVCATIAFGMGVDKSNVRYVLHYDLPKNIEGYYQETGRAGRDGLPSECVLFYGAGDAIRQRRFIDEIGDPAEKQAALDQLQRMIAYAESTTCRRRQLLAYFSEDWTEPNCGGCDNCTNPRPTFDGTLAAQKFLSCVHRIVEKSGFALGMKHAVEVITGQQTEKITRWGHDTISTYGIGGEHSAVEWEAIGRELLQLGYLTQSPDQYRAISVTPAGRQILRDRAPVQLTKPALVSEKRDSRRGGPRRSSAGDIPCDERLFEKLRQLRRKIADDRSVPAYVIFSDATLRQIAAAKPRSAEAFAKISGVGAQKLAEFGATFVTAVTEYERAA